MAFGLGYHRQLRALIVALSAYCIAVEAMQVVVPGRHARLADLVLNIGSALLGLGIAYVLIRLGARWGKSKGSPPERQ
jgi:VanZ family protein